jgi:CBS domain-containing protein
MLLRDVLGHKGREVHAISPNASLDDVISELVRLNIGSLLVRDTPTGAVLGIITERDILRAQASRQGPLEELRVAMFLTTELITVQPEDDTTEAMRLMTEHRIRHLPVIQGDELYGIVSIGDLVKAHHDELERENLDMLNYIQGGASSAIIPAAK